MKRLISGSKLVGGVLAALLLTANVAVVQAETMVINHTGTNVVSGAYPIPLRANPADSSCGMIVFEGQNDAATGQRLQVTKVALMIGNNIIQSTTPMMNRPFAADATITLRFVPNPDTFKVSDFWTPPANPVWTKTVKLSDYTYVNTSTNTWGTYPVPNPPTTSLYVSWYKTDFDVSSFGIMPAAGQRVAIAYAINDDTAQPVVPLSNYYVGSSTQRDRVSLGANLAGGIEYAGTVLDLGWTGSQLGAAIKAEVSPRLSTPRLVNGALRYTITATGDRTYQIEVAYNLNSPVIWSVLRSVTIPAGSTDATFDVPIPVNGSSMGFFRARY